MFDRYNLTETEMMGLFVMQSELCNWIRFEPKRLNKYLAERKEYVIEGLRSLEEYPFIGDSDDSDYLLCIQGLFNHEAKTKEEFFDHILTPEVRHHMSRKEEDLKQEDFDTQIFLKSMAHRMSSNDAVVIQEEEMRTLFEMPAKEMERFEASIRKLLLKKIREDMEAVYKQELVNTEEVRKVFDKDDLSLILMLCMSDFNIITKNKNETEKRKIQGDIYKHDARTGYNGFLPKALLAPEVCYMLARNRFYIGADVMHSDWMEDIAISAVEEFIRDEIYINLSKLDQKYKAKENAAEEFRPKVGMDVWSVAEQMKDKYTEATEKRNPYLIKREINKKPKGYYAKSVFTAFCMALLRESMKADRTIGMIERLNDNEGTKTIEYTTYQKAVNEIDEKKKDLKRKEKEMDNLRVLLEKQNQLLKEKDEQLQKKKEPGIIAVPDETYTEEISFLHLQVESLMKENKELKKKAAEQTARVEKLKHSLSEVKQRENGTGLLRPCTEEELYEGEVYDFLSDVMEEAAAASKEDTRRHDVLKGLLATNPPTHNLRRKQERLKAIFKGSTDVSERLKGQLKEIGVELTSETGKHAKFTLCGDGRYTFTLAKTPSDHRAGMNNAATVSDLMF